MKATIYKYPLKSARTELLLPKHSHFIHVGEQDDIIHIWVLHSSMEEWAETWILTQVFTGEIFDMENDHHFLGTVQKLNGLVVHIFAKKKDAQS